VNEERILGGMDVLLNRLGAVVVGLMMIASLFLLPTFISGSLGNGSGMQLGGDFSFSSPSSGNEFLSTPSVVTETFYSIGNAARGVGDVSYEVGRSIGHGAAAVGHFAAFCGQAVIGGIYNGTLAVVRGITGGLVFAVNTPANIVKHMATMSVASAIIAPANSEQAGTIDPSVYEFSSPRTAQVAIKKLPAVVTAPDTRVMWPIHGIITTLFGVPEPPYQPIHTGIDISDGKPSGVTPIHPFKQGKVIQVIYSTRTLGNHVVIDHGNGLTSVYGHMYSISVKVGQVVDTTTKLGTEGSTGVSTGTHLHFEIRLNDSPVNPMNYISGRP
jgi:hypothetical protein